MRTRDVEARPREDDATRAEESKVVPEHEMCPTVESIALDGGLARHALFFDVDGTIVDIAEAPDRVRVEPGLVDAVAALQALAGGAIAMITGRPVAAIDALFVPLRLPAAGQHGMERRDAAGRMHAHPHSEQQLEALRRCVATAATGWPGVLLEDKGATLAVHYRLAPGLAQDIHAALHDCLARHAEGFRLQPGKMVAELKPGGRDKGTAIEEFMQEPPFAGRVPVFVGDDATDEYGFAVVNRMNGHSVKVGAGDTVARWRFADAVSVRAWLGRLVARPR